MNAAENIRAPAIDVVVESALWDAQADAMEDLERKVLAALGVPDPYLTSREAAGV